MNSCIYTGYVTHRRFSPKPHRFQYKVFMMYLDLDELPELFEGRWFWSYLKPNLAYFRRSDYYGDPQHPLKAEILSAVEAKLGIRPSGKICLLTNLRYFGHCFNPVSFYYCYDANDQLTAIVSHITNTPWGESHAYVLDCRAQASAHLQFGFEKAFHISPFMPMEMKYDWQFSAPAKRLHILMQNRQAETSMFDATLVLKRKSCTAKTLNLMLLKYPFMTLKVITGIYWQALRLWLKRTPFYSHPNPSI